MAEYKLAPHGGVVRAADSAVIPEDDANRDWLAYLAWVTGGGVVDPADLTDLELAKEAATKRVEVSAAQAALDILGTPAEQAEFRAAEFEALLRSTDVVTNDADLPLLSSRIDATLTSTTKTANDVLATSKLNRVALDTSHQARKTDLATIVAATTVAQCEAVAPRTDAVGVPL